MDGTTEQDRPAKRQRLGKACKSCRTSKARCETQQDAAACHRCQVLDLECELPKRTSARVPAPAPVIHDDSNIENRLARVERMIAKLAEAVFPHSESILDSGTTNSLDAPAEGDTTETIIANNYPKPVEILQDLQSELYVQSGKPSSEQTDLVSVGLLPFDTAVQLLRTAVDRYRKWVPLDEVEGLIGNRDLPRSSPLLMNVLCLLATRYHPEVCPQKVQDIYKHVKRLVSDAVIDTPPVASSVVQALTLLCLFSPTVQTDKPLDSWHLSASTANHAVVAFGLSNVKQQHAAEQRNAEQLRVWSEICLTHLQYSIGSGRPLSIPIRLMDGCRRLLEQPKTMPFDTPLVVELQFYICLHTALQNPTVTPESAFTSWDSGWSRFLTSSGPPRTLELSHWFGHLLLHRRNASSQQGLTSQAMHERNKPAWRESANIVSQFVRHSSDQAPDLPDFAFFIASYAALVLCESAIDHHLVENLRAYLFRIACGETHIAFKHGYIIQRALERSRYADPSVEDATNGDTEMVHSIGTPLPSHFMGLSDFDALAGFDIAGEYFTVESLL